MTVKGEAYVIATAIYAGSSHGDSDHCDRVYTAVNAMDSFQHAEAKADVFAQLAERLTAHTPFAEAVDVITGAINETRRALMQ